MEDLEGAEMGRTRGKELQAGQCPWKQKAEGLLCVCA